MELLYLSLFAIGIYAVMTLCRRWADSFIMIAFAIGCVVNANIFTPFATPMAVGSLTFGIDAILMTMFIHLVAVKYIHYPLKDFKLFVASSIAAIIISAFIEFFANVFNDGYKTIYLINLGKYFIASFAIVVGIIVMVLFIKAVIKKRLSRYFALSMGILIATIIEVAIFYPLCVVIYQLDINVLWSTLGATFILRAICIALGVLCYFITSIWGHKDASIKFLDKAKQNVFDVELAKENDVDEWINLVIKYRHYFPGLETEQSLNKYRETVIRFISENRALLVRIEEEIVGVLLLSTKKNMVAFLLVDERYRRQGIGTALVTKAFESLNNEQPIYVKTYLKDDYRSHDAWNFYSKLGFKPTDIVEEDKGPEQIFELIRK